MPSTILPIDTVQAVWNSAFPALMQAVWGEDTADADSKDLLGTQGATILTAPDALTTWFRERFRRDGLEPGTVFNPFGSVVVSTSDAIHWTYVVHAGGIILPRMSGVATRPNLADVIPKEPSQRDVTDSLGGKVPWYASETQILALRTAATLATVEQWRMPTQSFNEARFMERVNTHWAHLLGDAVPGTFDYQLETIDGDATRERRNKRRYYNPEDGAGYFFARGYRMFTPPAPPLLSGLLGTPRDDHWQHPTGVACASYYASRQAYATPCTCESVDALYFTPSDRAVDPPA